MPLQYNDEWDEGWPYDSMPTKAIQAFGKILDGLVRRSENKWSVYEIFKNHFGRPGRSSTESYAETDMVQAMSTFADNPALYVISYYNALEEIDSKIELKNKVTRLNQILTDYEVPLAIEGRELILKIPDAVVLDSTDSEVNFDHPSTRLVFNRDNDMIGQGGFGTVYKVKRATSVGEFEYALKLFDPSVFQPNPSRCLDRFKREVAVLKSLRHHSIIQLIEAGVMLDGSPYMLLELIDGEHLDEYCRGQDWLGTLRLFCGVAEAVGYAHESGVLHRDLKPSNILVRKSDHHPIILDFGCAFVLDGIDELSLTTTIIGTQKYMPPEVLAEPLLKSTSQDIFALGVMLYEALSNRTFNLQNVSSLTNIHPSLHAVDAIIKKSTAAVASRYSNGLLLHKALLSYLKSVEQ